MAGVQGRGAPEREQPWMSARDRPHPTHEECLVIADGEMAQDLALRADRGVHQQGRPSGAEPPVDRSELVDQVTGLFTEQTGEAYLIPAQEMEAHSGSAFGHAEGVVDLRNAHEKVRRMDAALGHEPARQPLISASGALTVTTKYA